MKEFKSGCCDAPVEDRGERFFQAHCTKCSSALKWGLSHGHRWDAPGVYQDHDGRKWFCDSIVSSLQHLKDGLANGATIVCQVKDIIATIGLDHDTQDTDMLPNTAHIDFVRKWIKRVTNPEVGQAMLDRRTW